MKKLLIAALMLFSSTTFAADAVFTWTKPVPAFNAVVPPAWVIDEYRIYCSTDDGTGGAPVNIVINVPGYNTESHSETGLAPGNVTCYMTSWSVLANAESPGSTPITNFLTDGGTPNAPSSFDFSAAL